MASYTLADTSFLGRAWEQSGKPSLIVIDPPTNFLGDCDEHKNASVRHVLMALVTWINSLDIPVAVVLITHVSKPGGKGVEAINRVIGSVAWVSTCRIAHSFSADPNDPTRVLFSPMKSNIGKLGKGLAFRVKPTDTLAVVEWLGEVDTTADEAVNGEKRKPKAVIASEWLEDQFRARREWPAQEIKQRAKESGVSHRALWDAVQDLPIRKAPQHTADGERYWTWKAHPGWPPEHGTEGGEP
jgi:putative DNA primase/helicase